MGVSPVTGGGATVTYQKAIAATTILFAIAILVLVILIARAHLHGLKTMIYLTLVVDILFCASMILSSALLLDETREQLKEEPAA